MGSQKNENFKIRNFVGFIKTIHPILLGLVVAGLFSVTIYAFADPFNNPPTPYTAPAPLEPGCAPGDPGCTVSLPGYYVGMTNSSNYSGNLSVNSKVGYAAGNYLCSVDIAGSHMCSSSEILSTASLNPSSLPSLGTAWINNGPPGYTANSNDCSGRTSSNSAYLGSFWDFSTTAGGGAGFLTNCSILKKIACCK